MLFSCHWYVLTPFLYWKPFITLRTEMKSKISSFFSISEILLEVTFIKICLKTQRRIFKCGWQIKLFSRLFIIGNNYISMISRCYCGFLYIWGKFNYESYIKCKSAWNAYNRWKYVSLYRVGHQFLLIYILFNKTSKYKESLISLILNLNLKLWIYFSKKVTFGLFYIVRYLHYT